MAQPVIIQPLDPSLHPLLDPAFVRVWNSKVAYTTPVELAPSIQQFRENAIAIVGPWDAPKIASKTDYDIERCDSKGPPVKVRVYTPQGQVPEGGWPVFLYFHGGGFVVGSVKNDDWHCINFCATVGCVVISVEYSLAPEHIFPAGVEDVWESYLWLVSDRVKSQLPVPINPNKIVSGGNSAGANLAAVLSHLVVRKTNGNKKLLSQVLIVPVVDCNEGSFYESRTTLANIPALTTSRMDWFVNNYIPNKDQRNDLDASPIFNSDDDFKKQPATAFVAICEGDVLRDEGLLYAEKLKKNGIDVTLKLYERTPHLIMGMASVLEAGPRMIKDVSDYLDKVFYK